VGKSYAKKGDWNALCEVCNFKFKASQLRERWDGLRVCDEDYEERHPSDLFQAPIRGEQSLPWTSPDNDGTAVDVTFSVTADPIPDGHNNGDL